MAALMCRSPLRSKSPLTKRVKNIRHQKNVANLRAIFDGNSGVCEPVRMVRTAGRHGWFAGQTGIISSEEKEDGDNLLRQHEYLAEFARLRVALLILPHRRLIVGQISRTICRPTTPNFGLPNIVHSLNLIIKHHRC